MKVSEIKIGETYNGVKVLEKFREKGHTKYWCICPVCGKRFSMKAETIGIARQCKGCNAKSRIIDISGQRFGRLVALRFVGRVNGRTLWRCKCDCGKETITGYSNLYSGITRSCGCLGDESRKDTRFKKRRSVSREFEFQGNLDKHPLRLIWKSMLMRCNNPHVKNYNNYGGRGIKVCDRWSGNLGFENFVKDMGERPDGTTLDRIDYNGDYEPSNCHWATSDEQANNRTDNVFIIERDRQITAKQFCKALGLNYWVAIKQIQRGYDINIIAKDVRFNQGEYRRRSDLINHNRVVSDEVAALLESKLINQK